MRPRATHIFLGVLLLSSAGPSGKPHSGSAKLPSRLEQYLAAVVHLTPEEHARLVRREPVTKLLDADPNVEVAVFGAVWIDAPIRRYIEAVQDIENFERGGAFRVTKRISSPPKLEDFAQLQLPEEDIDALRTCKVGTCEVQLDAEALRRFREGIDWTAPHARVAANAVMRRLVLDYVNAYLTGGNSRLAVYTDSSRPTFVAREFRSMVDEMPVLTVYMPDVRRYLLDFPDAAPPDSNSLLYWQETRFGLKPTIRINHLVIREGPEDTVVASKMLYATHYFWTALELRALIPDPSRGNGFWLFTVTRSRSGGLSGFSGQLIRGRVEREVQEGLMTALNATKRYVERGRLAAPTRSEQR